MQKKKGPFTILKTQKQQDCEENKFENKRSQPPLFFENIFEDLDIQPGAPLLDRKIFISNPDESPSPLTDTTSNTGVYLRNNNELSDRYAGQVQNSRGMYQAMLSNLSQSLRVSNVLGPQREFTGQDNMFSWQFGEGNRTDNQNTGINEPLTDSLPFWNAPK